MIQKFNLYIPQFQQERRVHVYTPMGYETSTKRYPVLYMFDGHNLFEDNEATYGKSWNLAHTLDAMQKEIIVVGVECNHEGNMRICEYSPFSFSNIEYMGNVHALGKETMDFYTKQLKQYIDQNYRTLSDRKHTWIGGSSCGGTMAYFAGVQYSNVYSKALVISPFFHATMQKFKDMTNRAVMKPCDFYISWGAKESEDHAFVHETKACTDLANLLIQKNQFVQFQVKPEGTHSEASWEEEIPIFIEFLEKKYGSKHTR